MDFFNDIFHNLALLEFYFLNIIYILLYIDCILSIFFQHSNILTRASHHWCLASNIVLVLFCGNDSGFVVGCLFYIWRHGLTKYFHFSASFYSLQMVCKVRLAENDDLGKRCKCNLVLELNIFGVLHTVHKIHPYKSFLYCCFLNFCFHCYSINLHCHFSYT